MAVKLTSLRNMPDDEIADIRTLLEENRLDFYETPGGLMGLGSPVLWLKQSDDLATAKALLSDYNEERSKRVRAEYEAAKARGEVRTVLDELRDNPFRFITYMAFAVFLVWITLWPFWG